MVTLTDSGHRLVDHVVAEVLIAEEAIVEQLSVQERELLTDLLRRFLAALQLRDGD